MGLITGCIPGGGPDQPLVYQRQQGYILGMTGIQSPDPQAGPESPTRLTRLTRASLWAAGLTCYAVKDEHETEPGLADRGTR